MFGAAHRSNERFALRPSIAVLLAWTFRICKKNDRD